MVASAAMARQRTSATGNDAVSGGSAQRRAAALVPCAGGVRISRRFAGADAVRRAPRAIPRGFTLIEILVVLVIVAVLSIAATLALSGNAERRLADEAERFRALLAQSCQMAELGGREFGVVIDAEGYRFQRLDGTQWQGFRDGELRPRRWPEALRLDLTREGRPLLLATGERAMPQVVCFSTGELTPFVLTMALGEDARWRVLAREDGTLDSERVAAP